MTGWAVYLAAGLTYEAFALRGHAPTLSYVIRRLPKPLRATIIVATTVHFLVGE